MESKTFGRWFIALGVALQVIIYIVTGSALLSCISGILGVVSVVLCSQRKMHFYTFGFAQLITYVVLCYHQKLYGEIVENVFYFVTMLYGVFHWWNHYDDKMAEVETRKLSYGQNWLVALLVFFGVMILYGFLGGTDDTQPFMDSVTTVPAFMAQILMILRFRESWIYWLIIDIGSIIMWAIAGDWCMVSQFVFWSINCLYGLRKW